MKASKSFKTAKTETFREENEVDERLPKISLHVTRLEKNVEISLTAHEELEIIQKWARSYPQVLKIILEAKDNRIHCPFATECNEFPCEGLTCNADCCSNGNVYRMS